MLIHGLPPKLARDAWWLAEDPGALPPLPARRRDGQALATACLAVLLALGGLIVTERLILLRDAAVAAGADAGASARAPGAAILATEPGAREGRRPDGDPDRR